MRPKFYGVTSHTFPVLRSHQYQFYHVPTIQALERGEGANVQAELHACLQHGPGVFVVRNLQPGDAVCRMRCGARL